MIANLEHLKSLPVSERLTLIGDLLDSINDDNAELPPLSKQEIDELDRRVEHLKMHPESGVTWEQVTSHARSRRGR